MSAPGEDGAWLLPLTQAPPDAGEVGGKAAQLGLLLRAQLPVPGGFCLPASALERSLELAGLGAEARALSAVLAGASQGDGASPEVDALLRRGAALRERLADLPLPAGLLSALGGAWQELGAAAVAVRSSALQEDSEGASFAGQHHTSLGVTSLEGLIAGIRRCWASLFAEAALRYRITRGAAGRWGMGVVVQRLIDPRASGVLFTVNPMNGSRREMILDAGWGLGEAYVSGQASADSFVVARPLSPRARASLDILHQVVVPKPRMLRPAEGGALHWVDVPPADRDRPTLTPGEVRRIAELGLAAERLFGAPRDLEWALDAGGRAYVLQARPITTQVRPDTQRSRGDVLWTSRFSGERWTEAASPMGWSIISPILDHFVYFEDAARAHLRGSRPTRLYLGHPYFNITIFRHLLFKMPGSPPPWFMLEFFPREEQEEILRAPWIWPDFALFGTILLQVIRERRWERFAWQPLRNHRVWDAFQPGFERDIAAIPSAPTTLEDCQEATARCQALIRDYIGIHVTSLAFASIFYQLLDVLTRRWAGRADPALLSALITQAQGNKTMETNRALWELAREAQATPAVAATLGGSGPIPGLEELADLPGGRPFAERMGSFLERYGHRSVASWEIFSLRWEDDPRLPLAVIRSWLNAGLARDPDTLERRGEEERLAAEAQIRAAIDRGAPAGRRRLRQRLFEQVLTLTRSYSLLRENQRFYFDLLLLKCKRVLERQGALMAQAGLLPRGEDVVLLTLEEATALVAGQLPPQDAEALVASRRAARDEDLSAERPVFLRGEEQCADSSPTGSRTLCGLGISPGRITGKVRIIKTLAEGLKLRRGDILVTRATDPGWTPLFLTAGGLIMELGSVLSHGAVVAREYHLPAVVNISDATSVLKDGQTITLDGDRGVIYLH